MQDRVSIIIPVYNARRYIEDSLDSCLSQNYDNFEVIAVDDKSTDGTLDIMRQYWQELDPEKQQKLTIIARDKNGHTGAAMNTGIKAMTGEWFKEMQADDILLPHCLKNMMPKAKSHGMLEDTIFYADAHHIDYKGNRIYSWEEVDRNDCSAFEFNNTLLQHNIGNGITVLIHKSAFEKHGYFSETVQHEDYEHRLRWCLLEGVRMHYIPFFVAEYRHHDHQYTQSNTLHEHVAENTRIKKSIIDKMSPFDREAHRQVLIKRNFKRDDYLDVFNLTTLVDVIKHPRCFF